MKQDRALKRIFRQEFKNIEPNIIWQSRDGYQVFGRYKIQTKKTGYLVSSGLSDIGVFSSTRTALSWCIADKNCVYNTAREILRTDNKLTDLKNDISTRVAIGDRSRDHNFREIILAKLESKIIQKKLLENQLNKYVSWAKYIQHRGFQNETARTGPDQSKTTNCQGFRKLFW
jgi:hypothetical protein